MSNRTGDLVLSALACGIAFLLSWPFWRDFGTWPEGRVAWAAYFALGFGLAVHVFAVFLRSLRTLFTHEAHGHEDGGREEA